MSGTSAMALGVLLGILLMLGAEIYYKHKEGKHYASPYSNR